MIRFFATVIILANSVVAQSTTLSDSQLCGALASAAPAANAVAAGAQRVQTGGAVAQFFQGCVAYGQRGAEKAVSFFEKATKDDPTKSLYFDWLGRAYGDQAQRANKFRQTFLAKKTKSAFETAVALDPNNLDARGYLVDYYQLAPGIMGGSESRASEQIEAIRTRNPYRGGLVAATAQNRRKDLAGVERELTKLVATYADSLPPRFALIAHYVGAKRWVDAFRAVDAARAAHPASRVLDYQVARIAALSGEQLERGDAAARKYLSGAPPGPGDPTFAGAHMRLGQILAHRGQAASARSELQEALKLDPSLKEAKASLGSIK